MAYAIQSNISSLWLAPWRRFLTGNKDTDLALRPITSETPIQMSMKQFIGICLTVVGAFIGAFGTFAVYFNGELKEINAAVTANAIQLASLSAEIQTSASKALFEGAPDIKRAGLDFHTFNPLGNSIVLNAGLNYPVLVGQKLNTMSPKDSPFYLPEISSWSATFCSEEIETSVTDTSSIAKFCFPVPAKVETVERLLDGWSLVDGTSSNKSEKAAEILGVPTGFEAWELLKLRSPIIPSN